VSFTLGTGVSTGLRTVDDRYVLCPIILYTSAAAQATIPLTVRYIDSAVALSTVGQVTITALVRSHCSCVFQWRQLCGRRNVGNACRYAWCFEYGRPFVDKRLKLYASTNAASNAHFASKPPCQRRSSTLASIGTSGIGLDPVHTIWLCAFQPLVQ